jgi:hypothetical protein
MSLEESTNEKCTGEQNIVNTIKSSGLVIDSGSITGTGKSVKSM